MKLRKFSVPIFTLLCILLGACGTKEDVTFKNEVSVMNSNKQSKKQSEEDNLEQNIENDTPATAIEREKTEELESTKKDIPQRKLAEQQDEINDEQKEGLQKKPKNSQEKVKLVVAEHDEIKGKERTEQKTKANSKTGQERKTPETKTSQKNNKSFKKTEKQGEPLSQTVKAGVPTINALLPQRNSEQRTTPITHVVTHFISNAANNPQDPYNVQDTRQIFIEYGVSAHYMIGRNGEIYHLVPENRVAYHAGKGNLPKFPHYKDQLNAYSIGIEIMAIGTKEEMRLGMSGSVYQSIDPAHIGYTDAQYKSLNRLLNDILIRNPSIPKDKQHIVGHDEYAPSRKSDPGSLFNWSKIGL